MQGSTSRSLVCRPQKSSYWCKCSFSGWYCHRYSVYSPTRSWSILGLFQIILSYAHPCRPSRPSPRRSISTCSTSAARARALYPPYLHINNLGLSSVSARFDWERWISPNDGFILGRLSCERFIGVSGRIGTDSRCGKAGRDSANQYDSIGYGVNRFSCRINHLTVYQLTDNFACHVEDTNASYFQHFILAYKISVIAMLRDTFIYCWRLATIESSPANHAYCQTP